MRSNATIVLNGDGTVTETTTIPTLITFAEAAQMLELESRLDIVNLVREDKLKVELSENGHSMVRSHDVVRLGVGMRAQRRKSFEELRDLTQE